MIKFIILVALYCIVIGVIIRLAELVDSIHDEVLIGLVACFWPIVLIIGPCILLICLGSWITGKIIDK